jgi:hypothetical protein
VCQQPSMPIAWNNHPSLLQRDDVGNAPRIDEDETTEDRSLHLSSCLGALTLSFMPYLFYQPSLNTALRLA